MQTQTLPQTTDGIAQAAALLRAGQLVALPTETVYGLAGDASNPDAIAAIYAAKGRPAHNPLIVHLPDLDAAQRIAMLDGPLLILAEAFWPGPLTLVAPLRDGHGLAAAVTAGLETVALRVPAHPLAQGVLRATGRGIAAPSANPSGRISPSTAAHVQAGLGGKIAAILDGGPCAVGLESSIVGLEDGHPVLLRAGGIDLPHLERVLGTPLRAPKPGQISAPGQLASHYAPDAPVRLDAIGAQPGEYWIGFGPNCPGADANLSETGDLVQAAANLFATLHRANATGQPIAIAPVPAHGLGAAINDRLRRAAAPRTP